MFFDARKHEYNTGKGPVRYMDGTSLLRPSEMPKQQKLILCGFIAAAALIGGILVFNILDNVTHSAERAQASVEQNLARPSAMLSLPSLPVLFNLDDDGIKAAFAEAKYGTIDMTKTEGDGAGLLDIIKLPDDVSVPEAGLLYQKGVTSLSASEVALLLNGSWRLSVERGDFTDMRVKYADFTSGSLEASILAAITAEGFDPASASVSSIDEAGNTFREGTIAVGDETLKWRVSAIALSSVYDVKGLPETATYVGVRLNP